MRLLNFSVVGRSSDTWGHPRRSEEGIEEEDRSTKRKQNKHGIMLEWRRQVVVTVAVVVGPKKFINMN